MASDFIGYHGDDIGNNFVIKVSTYAPISLSHLYHHMVSEINWITEYNS